MTDPGAAYNFRLIFRNAAETSSSAPVQGDNDIASQVPLSTKPMIGNLLLAEDSPAKFSALTEMHSAQLYWLVPVLHSVTS